MAAAVGVEGPERRLRVGAGAGAEAVGEAVRKVAQVERGEPSGEVTRQIGGVGLDDRQRVQEARREEIERHDAALGVGARQPVPVQHRAGVALLQAADVDVLVVLDEHRRGLGDHVRSIRTGRLLHRLRADGLADGRRLLALRQLRLLGGLLEGDDLHHLLWGVAEGGQADVGLQRLVRRHGDALHAHRLILRAEEAHVVRARLDVDDVLPVDVGAHGRSAADDLHAGIGNRVAGVAVDDGPGDGSGRLGGGCRVLGVGMTHQRAGVEQGQA